MLDFTSPDNKHSVLITIDVQRDFVLSGSSIEIPGTIHAARNIQILAQCYRNLDYPIIHAVRLYHQDGSNVDPCRGEAVMNGKQIVITGSAGAEIIDELKPSINTRLDSSLLLSGRLQHIGPVECIMYKPRWGSILQNSFRGTFAQLRR
jgi:nicotinamidase-related amidase